MSGHLQKAVECGSCGNGSTRAVAQESETPHVPEQEPQAPAAEVGNAEQKTVVMEGPLGSAMSAALDNVLAKDNQQGLSIAVESLAGTFSRHVQANGMIHDEEGFMGAIRKSVGIVPRHGEEPTVINTMLDAMSRVRDMDFVFVNNAMTDGNDKHTQTSTHVHVVGSDGTNVTPKYDNAALEGYEVEQVQMIVRVRPKRR